MIMMKAIISSCISASVWMIMAETLAIIFCLLTYIKIWQVSNVHTHLYSDSIVHKNYCLMFLFAATWLSDFYVHLLGGSNCYQRKLSNLTVYIIQLFVFTFAKVRGSLQHLVLSYLQLNSWLPIGYK